MSVEGSNSELIHSGECYSVFNGGKKKKSTLRLVHLSAQEIGRKLSSSQLSKRSSASNLSSPSPLIVCGAKLEVYECGLLSKKKLLYDFNLSSLTKVYVEPPSPSKRKHVVQRLCVHFGESKKLILLFEDSKKPDEANDWCERLSTIASQSDQLFKWHYNSVFTVNSAYTGSYVVYVISERRGIDSKERFEMKILLECILLLRQEVISADINASSVYSANNLTLQASVALYWPIMSIKKFGLHVNDNHLFAIEYTTEPDGENTNVETMDTCIFRSPFAISLVNQISKRVKELDKLEPSKIYTEIDKRNRLSTLQQMRKSVICNESSSNPNNREQDDCENIELPPRNYGDETTEVVYKSFDQEDFETCFGEKSSSFSNKTPVSMTLRSEGGDPLYHDLDFEAERREGLVDNKMGGRGNFDDDECYYESVDVCNIKKSLSNKSTEPALSLKPTLRMGSGSGMKSPDFDMSGDISKSSSHSSIQNLSPVASPRIAKNKKHSNASNISSSSNKVVYHI